MGRFERKIKQRMQRNVEDFDVWFAKNREKLGNFAAQSDEEEESENGVKKLKKKAKWLIPLAFVLLAVCVTLCFLPGCQARPVRFLYSGREIGLADQRRFSGFSDAGCRVGTDGLLSRHDTDRI